MELDGRAREMAILRARLADARRARGGVILLAGEAGLGKTTLASALASEAEGFRVDTGRALEIGESPPWFPLRSCLRALGIDPGTLPTSDAGAFALWEQVLERLVQEPGPVLWILEDLHRADAQTLDLLTFLAHPAQRLALLIVATVRPDPASRGIHRLARDATRIDLSLLGPEEVRAIVRRISGRALDDRELAEWLERTGGNPLFVVECARARRKVPVTIAQIVRDRLAPLPASTAAAIERGAVLGREFSAATIGRMIDRLPAAVIDALMPGLDRGLIEELEPGSFRFVHAIIRDAVYELLAPELRRKLHQEAEAAIALMGASPDNVVTRATHALGAIGALAEAHVEQVVMSAVREQSRAGAHDRAYALWRRWSASQSRVLAAQDFIEATRLATRAGSYADAKKHALAALAAAHDDPPSFAEAALAMGANLRPAVVDPDLVRALERALAELAPAERVLRCRVQARLSAALLPRRDPDFAIGLARDAISEARAIGDRDLVREVLFLTGAALTDTVDVTELMPLTDELLESAIDASDHERALRAFVRRALEHLQVGAHDAFTVDVDRMIALARSAGHPRLVWRPLLVGSMRALARGDFAESDRLCMEVEQLGQLTDDPALAMSLAAHNGMRLLTFDRRAEAARAIEALGPSVDPVPDYGPLVRAMFALRLEDRAGVLLHLPQIVRSRAWRHAPDYLAVAGEAVAFAGSDAEKRAALAELVPLAGREVHTGHVPYTYEGPVDRVIGLLEASLGRNAEALVWIDRALATCQAQRFLPWIERISRERSRILAALGQQEVAPEPVRTSVPAAAPLTLDREGEIWCVRWNGREARVKDSRGVQMLMQLIGAPNDRIHALVLSGSELVQGEAGEAIDPAALKAYRARLLALREDLEEAEARGNVRRAEGLRREQEFLAEELGRSTGLGGRARKLGSISERARVNVTRRIKDAIARITEVDPQIGAHLADAVRTGTYCSYRG